MSSTNKEYRCIIYITIIKCLKCVEFSVLRFLVLRILVIEKESRKTRRKQLAENSPADNSSPEEKIN